MRQYKFFRQLLLAMPLLALLAFMPGRAEALCCSWSASGACNIFGCNCDGPCANFGKKCGKPVSVNGVCGTCADYYTLVDGTTCKYTSRGSSVCTPMAAETGTKVGSSVGVRGMTVSTDEYFAAIDTDSSGGITLSEATTWAATHHPELDVDAISDQLRAVDTNKNGIVELQEFDSTPQ
mgnify:CR=1 FL=1